MDKSKECEVIKKAKEIAKNTGGKIFAFPVENDNPFSQFALVVRISGKYMVFDDLLDMRGVAQGILETRKMLNKNGIKTNYDKDVRFVLYEPQKNQAIRIINSVNPTLN